MSPKDANQSAGLHSELNAETQSMEGELKQGAHEGRALKRVLVVGLVVGLFYGIVTRLAFGLGGKAGIENHVSGPWYAAFSVMSVAFLFGVPFVMGFCVAYLGRIPGMWRAIWMPQLAALAALALALATAVEGLICVVFWLPAYIALTAAGGVAGCLLVRVRKNRDAFLGLVFLMPYGVALVEHEIPAALDVRRVETQIDIDAPADLVWEQIVDVPVIEEDEHGFAWSHVIGFPRPVSARSSSRSLGALREARFERGVVFFERVTRYEPYSTLEFDITADDRSVPEGALDEHVTLGGPYFDVLHGAYRIEPLANGTTRLHLSSEHRLSTHFNSYAASWTDFVMRDTQNYILKIVARRAENSRN
jgi:hypothetical protein